MRKKVGSADNVTLIAWAKHRINGGDQEIDNPARDGRFA